MATALVTGANRGIGLQLCKTLAARGERVVGVCRQGSTELDQIGIEVVSEIDVTADAAVAQLVQQVTQPLDLLILNAGILRHESLDDLDFEQMRQQFEVNTLGPLRVISALLPKLNKGAKIALITSRMGSIGDNSSGSRYGYRMSKAALNMAGVSLAHDLRPREIAVAIIHPGFVRTAMTDYQGNIEPEEAASGIIARVDELTLQTSGNFWHSNGELLPW